MARRKISPLIAAIVAMLAAIFSSSLVLSLALPAGSEVYILFVVAVLVFVGVMQLFGYRLY